MAKKASSPNKAKLDKEIKRSWLNVFKKAHVFDDKDEVLDVVYWSRQILALFMGMIWGVLGLTGILGIAAFAILNSIAAYAIANRTGYEFDSDENFSSVKEGFMATFATFLVSWIVTYTATYYR